jgi:hypothetical protein
MKKTLKLSLVAAVAVAGLTSTAVAADKVSYSGKVYVENFAESMGDSNDMTGYDIDFDLTGKAKINDSFTAVVEVQADGGTKDNEKSGHTNVTMSKAYFAYANSGLALNVGRQAISTPTTDGETGEGAKASYTMGNITAAAAHFGNNPYSKEVGGIKVSNNQDTHAVAVLGTAGPANFELWNVAIADYFTSNTIVLGAKAAGVSFGVRYSSTNYEDKKDANCATTKTKDGKTTIVNVGAEVAKVNLSFKYLMNDEEGATMTTSSASANTIELVKLNVRNMADTKAFLLGVKAPITTTLTASVDYLSVTQTMAAGTVAKKDVTDTEVAVKVSNKFAKSLTGTIRYATLTADKTANDKKQLRADLTYKF